MVEALDYASEGCEFNNLILKGHLSPPRREMGTRSIGLGQPKGDGWDAGHITLSCAVGYELMVA